MDTKNKLDKQMGESVETEFTEKWKDPKMGFRSSFQVNFRDW